MRLNLERRVVFAHVDVCGKDLIAGWAVCETNPGDLPAVNIVQNGKRFATVYPAFPNESVVKHFNLSASPGLPVTWRYYLPLASGLSPDDEIQFFVDGTDVRICENRTFSIPTFGEKFLDATENIREQPFIHVHPARVRDSHVIHAVDFSWPAGYEPTYAVNDKVLESKNFLKECGPFGHKQSRETIVLSEADFDDNGIATIRMCSNNPDDDYLLTLRQAAVHNELLGGEPVSVLPPEENIHRVCGPNSTQESFSAGGITTFRQIDNLSRRYLGTPVSDLDLVVDWGVGCGRVARHFSTAPARLLGFDVDPVNVEWCKKHLSDVGEFSLLSDENSSVGPPGSVDLLYGISVMTHLTELRQQQWLQRISDALKPGGIAILTTHGEYVFLRDPRSIAITYLERFGFFDGIPDPAIGEDRTLEYRATYQSTEYTLRMWQDLFEIEAIYPGTNAWRQDVVVLRKRA